MKQPVIQVDAFTNQRFAGNPAAVCVLSEKLSDETMQSIAKEMSLPETAFLLPEVDGFRLRWFAPESEVDLCGHATLASAHVLWEQAILAEGEVARFFTRSGMLTAVQADDGWISLDFPAEPAEPVDCDRLDGSVEVAVVERLAKLLENSPMSWVGRNRMDYLVELQSEEAVRALNPDMGLLKSIPTRGLIITARAQADNVDFVSRFFAPRLGVDEDPVTGSAHCCLAPYWSGKLGKTAMVGHQVSGRGGVVRVDLCDDRVILSGQAVTVMHGELDLG